MVSKFASTHVVAKVLRKEFLATKERNPFCRSYFGIGRVVLDNPDSVDTRIDLAQKNRIGLHSLFIGTD